MRNLATSLILHNRIQTTLPKAKELRPVVESLVTMGKKGTLAARRRAMAYLFAINREGEGNCQKLTAVHKLFTEIAPKFEQRSGGYTRILKVGKRDGDKAELALIEFVEGEVKQTPKRRRRAIKRSDAASSDSAPEAITATE
jgi:large subunit ribosomal protein L17